MSDNNASSQGLPQPDPALKRLERLVGTWGMKGHLVGSDEENIIGRATFQWLEGGFFMQQDLEIDFVDMMKIKSRELIGYDPETKAFSKFLLKKTPKETMTYESHQAFCNRPFFDRHPGGA